MSGVNRSREIGRDICALRPGLRVFPIRPLQYLLFPAYQRWPSCVIGLCLLPDTSTLLFLAWIVMGVPCWGLTGFVSVI